jgi:hypothetical protein
MMENWWVEKAKLKPFFYKWIRRKELSAKDSKNLEVNGEYVFNLKK